MPGPSIRDCKHAGSAFRSIASFCDNAAAAKAHLAAEKLAGAFATSS